MKKNIIAKIGAAAVVLTMVTTSLVGGTFAKYTSTVNGNVSATVAKWAVAFKEGENNDLTVSSAEITLKNENLEATTADGKIAPGSSGEIKLNINGNGSEVGYTYKISANNSNINSIPIKFYEEEDHINVIEFTDNEAEVANGTVELKDVAIPENVSIYWAWDSASGNDADTPLGEAATIGTITLTMTAEQLITPAPVE